MDKFRVVLSYHHGVAYGRTIPETSEGFTLIVIGFIDESYSQDSDQSYS